MQSGLKEALKHLSDHEKNRLKAFSQLINKRAEQTVTQAKENTPVDTGFLRSTIHNNLKVGVNGGITVYIGANTDYALYVHENPNSKGYKFLEKAFEKYFNEIDNELRKL